MYPVYSYRPKKIPPKALNPYKPLTIELLPPYLHQSIPELPALITQRPIIKNRCLHIIDTDKIYNENPLRYGGVGDRKIEFTARYQYDPWGRVAAAVDHNGYTVNYAYHVNGQRKSVLVNAPDDDFYDTEPGAELYNVSYDYDKAGRMDAVYDDATEIISFGYDNNGNRDYIQYNTAARIDYTYDINNRLDEFSTSDGPTFTLSNTTVDGQGRLVNADEQITDTLTAQNVISYSYDNAYDRMSRLTSAKQTLNLPTPVYFEHVHTYDDAGNMIQHEYEDNGSSDTTLYDFTGNQVIGDTGNNFEVTWDNNGRQTSQWCEDGDTADFKLEYDFEGRLREAWDGGETDKMIAQYAPSGVRVYKERIWSDDSDYKHKYIVDTASKLPKILVVLDADNSDAVIKKYIHAQDQIIAQHDIINDTSTPPEVVTDNLYFYLHDRLGSVRQIIDTNGDVVNAYTYDPWGLPLTSATADTIGKETKENISNPYQFANYIYDAEIKMYYCNAREYDPVLARFTSRDPVLGTFENPMTLHAYLYCLNDPVNNWDPSGEFFIGLLDTMNTMAIRGAEEGLAAPVLCRALWMAKNIVQAVTNLSNLKTLALWGDKALRYGGIAGRYVGAGLRVIGGKAAMAGEEAWIAARGLTAITRVYATAATQSVQTMASQAITRAGYFIMYNEIYFPGSTADFVTNLFGEPHPPFTPLGAMGTIGYEVVNDIAEEIWN